MPDRVDPLGRCLNGLLGDIDAGLAAAFLENRVGEAEVGAEAAVEGVVGRGDVVVAPAELDRVDGQHEDVEAGVPGAG